MIWTDRKWVVLFYAALLTLVACNSAVSGVNDNALPTQVGGNEVAEEMEESLPSVPVTQAYVDQVAMNEITEYLETDGLSTIEIYAMPVDETEKWAETFWGRCCTEADMTFTEYLSYQVTASHEGKAYPFANALDEKYSTAYVFKEEDQVSIKVNLNPETVSYRSDNAKIIDLIKTTDTIVNPFRISLINGYVKSENTYAENARIAEVELWLNGEHKCNCDLLDVPEPQVVLGNFPLFKNDVVELKPIRFFKGSKFDDVCISAIQFNLGSIGHPLLNTNYSIWGN